MTEIMPKTTMTRRQFGAGALLLAADAALGEAKTPQASFPVDPRERIGVATYPFRRWILSPHNEDRDASKPGMDLPAFARLIKSEFHVSGIEPLDSHFPSKERAEIIKLRARPSTRPGCGWSTSRSMSQWNSALTMQPSERRGTRRTGIGSK